MVLGFAFQPLARACLISASKAQLPIADSLGMF